ncbi:MAG TPA: low-specificity L-threonine aldolase [Clostridia bacterium]|nr:low-specificity L-threonine aldolase [Clostridia bacterium]
MIDLRSDTVTKPTEEMRQAMARAEVGDDVYGEDPTVNELERRAGEILGKEAALFVPSGTMGNQVAVLTHTQRGDEIILDTNCHITSYEVGSASMLGGVQLRTIPGFLFGDTVSFIQEAYRETNIHFPTSRLVCLENTFNRGGGTVMGVEKMKEIYQFSKELQLAVHLDGARLFNAAIASKCHVQEYTRYSDSVMCCLSKGLGAPVGSILAGSKKFIAAARKYRKALGGGMRQAGILAAAGLIALEMVDRLEEDHHNARLLGEGLNQIKGLKVHLEQVQTNMVFLDASELPMGPHALVTEMKKAGILASVIAEKGQIRLVTHKDISTKDILHSVQVIKDIVQSGEVS